MAQIKAHQAESFLKSPDPRVTAFLFFGSDPGLIGERARLLADYIAKRDQGEVIRLDDADLDNDPDRITVELQTIPMFGGRKIVRTSHGRRVNTPMLKGLVEGPPIAGVLIVEAGNLKPDESLRALFEKNAAAAAIACYADEAPDLDRLVTSVLKGERIGIAPDARDALVARLGADRALSRGEIEKLALYAQGQAEITLDDVDAVVGDGSELAIEKIPLAAASGNAAQALADFDRVVAAGDSAQAVIIFTLRHFQRLHRLRAEMDRGRTLDDAVRALRPPLHFKLKDAIAAQCRLWSAPRLADALSRISATAKAARLNGALEDPLTTQLLIDIAGMARPAPQAAARS